MDSTLQNRLHVWRQRNFPNADADEQLLGMVEEVGELSHAVLKHKQGIRGFENEIKFAAAQVDALGDLLIYLAGYCSYKGFDMMTLFEEVAKEVMERDWIKYPGNGFPVITELQE